MNDLKIVVNPIVEANNLDTYSKEIKKQIASVNTDLQTDEDFAEAENITKLFKKSEQSLMNAKEAIFDSGDLRKINDTIIELHNACRETRLSLEKQVKTRKAEIKTEMVKAAYQTALDVKQDAEFEKYITMPSYSEFESQIKGKRTTQSMKDALDRFTGITIQEITSQAKALNKKKVTIENLIKGHETLFNIEFLMTFPGSVEELIQRKIQEHNTQVEAQVAAKAAAATQAALQAQQKVEPEKPQPANDAPADPPLPTPPAAAMPIPQGSNKAHFIVRVDLHTTTEAAQSLAKSLANTYGRQNVKLTKESSGVAA